MHQFEYSDVFGRTRLDPGATGNGVGQLLSLRHPKSGDVQDYSFRVVFSPPPPFSCLLYLVSCFFPLLEFEDLVMQNSSLMSWGLFVVEKTR